MYSGLWRSLLDSRTYSVVLVWNKKHKSTKYALHRVKIGATKLSIMTLSIMTLNITVNNSKLNETLGTMTLSKMLLCFDAECHLS
jgi:hypothetical protein